MWGTTTAVTQTFTEAAKLRVSVAAVVHQESNQRTHHLDIGAIDDRAAVASAADQAGTRQNAEMRGERVVRAADRMGDCSGRRAVGLAPHEQPEDIQPRRLTKRRRCRQRMRSRNFVAARRRTDMADNCQGILSHPSHHRI